MSLQLRLTYLASANCRHHFGTGQPWRRMYATVQRYATISSGRSLRGKGAPLSLEHFVQRQKVMALWRECVRTIYKIPRSSSTRDEMRDFARHEFERYRHVNDLGHIRYLCSTGKTQLDSMRRYVEQNAM